MFSVFQSLQLSSYTWGYDVGVGGGGGWGVEYCDLGVSKQLCMGTWYGGGVGTFWFRSFRAVNCVDMIWGRGRGRGVQVLQTSVAIVLGSETIATLVNYTYIFNFSWCTVLLVSRSSVIHCRHMYNIRSLRSHVSWSLQYSGVFFRFVFHVAPSTKISKNKN